MVQYVSTCICIPYNMYTCMCEGGTCNTVHFTDGMVTGGMYSNPYYVDCSKMRASFVTVGRPVLNYARAKKPSRVEDTQPQRPPEANPPQKPPENFERGQLSKVNPPFKKRQWSDPPGRNALCYL